MLINSSFFSILSQLLTLFLSLQWLIFTCYSYSWHVITCFSFLWMMVPQLDTPLEVGLWNYLVKTNSITSLGGRKAYRLQVCVGHSYSVWKPSTIITWMKVKNWNECIWVEFSNHITVSIIINILDLVSWLWLVSKPGNISHCHRR